MSVSSQNNVRCVDNHPTVRVATRPELGAMLDRRMCSPSLSGARDDETQGIVHAWTRAWNEVSSIIPFYT